MAPFEDYIDDYDSSDGEVVMEKSRIGEPISRPDPKQQQQVEPPQNDSGVSTEPEHGGTLNRFLEDVEKSRRNPAGEDVEEMVELLSRVYLAQERDSRETGKQLNNFNAEFGKFADLLASRIAHSRPETRTQKRPISTSSLPALVSASSKIERNRAASDVNMISPPDEHYSVELLESDRVNADYFSKKNKKQPADLKRRKTNSRLNEPAPRKRHPAEVFDHLETARESRYRVPSASTHRSSAATRNCYHTTIYQCPCANRHTTVRRDYPDDDLIARLKEMKNDVKVLGRGARAMRGLRS